MEDRMTDESRNEVSAKHGEGTGALLAGLAIPLAAAAGYAAGIGLTHFQYEDEIANSDKIRTYAFSCAASMEALAAMKRYPVLEKPLVGWFVLPKNEPQRGDPP